MGAFSLLVVDITKEKGVRTVPGGFWLLSGSISRIGLSLLEYITARLCP